MEKEGYVIPVRPQSEQETCTVEATKRLVHELQQLRFTALSCHVVAFSEYLFLLPF